MDKEADEIQQREALREELCAAQAAAKKATEDVSLFRSWAIAMSVLCITFGLTATGFAIALFGGTKLECPKCQPAMIVGDNSVATALPGTEPNETASTETYPLSVSIDGHKRCFVLKWDGSIDRDAECGYAVDFRNLRKAVCRHEQ